MHDYYHNRPKGHYLFTSSMVFFLRSSYLCSTSCTSFTNWSFWFASRFSLCKRLFPPSVTLVTSGSRALTSSDKACEKDSVKKTCWSISLTVSEGSIFLWASHYLYGKLTPLSDPKFPLNKLNHSKVHTETSAKLTFAAAKRSLLGLKSSGFGSCFWLRNFSSHKSSLSFKSSRFNSQSRILFRFSIST